MRKSCRTRLKWKEIQALQTENGSFKADRCMKSELGIGEMSETRERADSLYLRHLPLLRLLDEKVKVLHRRRD